MSTNPQPRPHAFDDDREIERFDLTPGNAVTGILHDVEERSSDFGPAPYKFLVIDCEQTGRLLGVPAWHFGLRQKLAQLKPQIGERVRIKVLGETKTASGQKFMRYDVRVDRQQSRRVNYDADVQLTGESVLTPTGDTLEVSRKSASPFDVDDDSELPF
jgi:hypothetical protein